jgi:transposase
MTGKTGIVIGGVDTHKDMHWVAAVDANGVRLDARPFSTDAKDYKKAIAWLRSLGTLARIGMECSGTYGAGLCRHAQDEGIEVLEVTAPDRCQRRLKGKDDAKDAWQAAEAARVGIRCSKAKDRSSEVEGLRSLKAVYDGAVKARTAALCALQSLVVAEGGPLRESLRGLDGMGMARTCASWRITGNGSGGRARADKVALRSIAKRILVLDAEKEALGAGIARLCQEMAPQTMALPGVGAQCTARLILSIGANPHRMRDEACFSMLCGTSPLPASSGRTNRHRLSRGGDRLANSAIHRIVICRIGKDQRTKDYIARRIEGGKSKLEAIRCLKRYVAREVYGTLMADLGPWLRAGQDA